MRKRYVAFIPARKHLISSFIDRESTKAASLFMYTSKEEVHASYIAFLMGLLGSASG